MKHHPRFRLVLLAALVLFIASSSASLAGVIYVKWDSPNDGPGNDWDHAFHSVQAGLDAAVSSDEVWVAAGTYVENVRLRDGVGLYGGFAGTETLREQRDWTANVTILDGNEAGSVVTSPSGATVTTAIDGFTIRHGRANFGGGIFCEDSSPTITNNIITGNTAECGGGIRCHNSSPMVTNNTITGNSAYDGGGVYCTYSAPTIANNTIIGNSASSGAGIYCRDSFPMITNNTIAGNRGEYGSGVFCRSSSAMITNSAITGNSAFWGGGIFCGDSSPTITNNTITGNGADKGGGMYCYGSSSSPEIVNNIVAVNSSGVYNRDGTPVLRNNCVYGNTGYNYSGLTDPTGTDGNISVDPRLAGAEYGNVHIQPDSPCIDAGDDSAVDPGWVDMDGEPRIQGVYVDIGTDESDGTAWPEGPYVIVRVSPDGDDANDGSSWAQAKRTVQAGIDAASTQGGEVWAKAGIHYERINLVPYAYVYGGFAGIEMRREERDWATNVTILDGEQSGSVVRADHPGYLLSALDGFTIRNGSASSGAGIYCRSSSPMIANNTITGNSAYDGGGLFCAFSSFPNITNNTITGNSSSDNGGGIHCLLSSPTITNNTITGNSALWHSGGIHCLYSSPTIRGNTITGNAAYYGGGIGSTHASPTVTNNAITGNSASDGGGIFCGDLSPTIINNAIIGNSASSDGGGIYCWYSSPTITNNTIAGNSASDGGGVFCTGDPHPSLANNAIAFNSSGIWWHSGTPAHRNNCVYGNTDYDYVGLAPGAGDISEDPLFVDRPGGDYHLSPSSPCVNAGWNEAPGLPSLDMDGEGRIFGGTVDIGADEVWEVIVLIDIKPGVYPNVINLGSRALIPVAVLTGGGFDATAVDPTTLAMAGSPVAARGSKAKLLFAHPDVDDDGDTDLLVLFDTRNLVLDPGATDATLTGQTYDGTMIQSSDSVVVVSKE